jgi:hypothetical protein
VVGKEISFSGHGTDEDGVITSYLWESSINGHLNDSKSFSSSSLGVGIHTIYFRVMDDKNTWSQNAIGNVEIEPKAQNQIPTAYIDSISSTQGIEGDTISFRGHGADNDGSIANYLWESDIDGELSVQSDFSTSMLSVGSHLISFKVQDNNDAWSEAVTENISIEAEPPNNAPTAEIESISPNPAKEGERVSFLGLGNDEDGLVETYSWESNIDGFLSSKRSFSTSEMSVGDHIITFKVEDDDGMWSGAVTRILNVYEKKENSEAYDLPIFVLLGFALLAITIIAIAFAISRKKKSTGETTKVLCPNCGSAIDVMSTEGSNTVQCPICDYVSTFN